MTTTIRAHFDGNVIVPDEPVDLPVDEPLTIEVMPRAVSTNRADSMSAWQQELEFIKKRVGDRWTAAGKPAGPRTWRREDLYE